MVATTFQQPKTYEDYLQTPDDGQRYELIDGEIVVSPSPLKLHQWVSGHLFSRLFSAAVTSGLGIVLAAPMDVRLARDIVVQPDLIFIAHGSEADDPDEPRIAGAPDLVVEILSPSTAMRDLNRKRSLYAEYGVKEYWIVNPLGRTIMPLTLNETCFIPIPETDGRFRSRVLPDFELNVPAFFDALF